MRVGIDLDGVCYDFDGALRYYLMEFHGWAVQRMPAPVRWEFYLDWGLQLQDFMRLCDQAANAGVLWRHGGPLPGVHDAFWRLRNAGHSIHIVTARNFGHPGVAERATAWWLAKHGLPFDSLTFSEDKTVVRTDVAIDDLPDHCRALSKAGTEAYLCTRPWNKGAHRMRRVPSLAEFAVAVS